MTIWLNILRRKLKDYKTLLLMSIFPIMLTIIFVKMFTVTNNVDGTITLSVHVQQQEGALTRAVSSFMEQLSHEESIQLELVQEEEAALVIQIDEAMQVISVVNQSGDMIEESTLISILEQFASRYGLQVKMQVLQEEAIVIEETIIQGKGTSDFLTPLVVTMLVFGIMLGGSFGINQIFYMKQAVGWRALTAPISSYKLFIMEYTTSSFIIWIMGIVTAACYQVIFNVHFFKVPTITILILLIASLLTTLLGMTIGLYVREKDMGENILSIIITFSAILSGKLMPMFELGKITNLSPIKPLVEQLEDIIQTGQLMNRGSFIGYIVIIFVILLGIVVLKLRRGEEIL